MINKPFKISMLASIVISYPAIAQTSPNSNVSFSEILKTLQNKENKGLHLGINLGTHTQAVGLGAVATGKSSIAVGNNTLATAKNQTKASIEQKHQENEDNLIALKHQEQEITTLTSSVIQSQIAQAKASAALERVTQKNQEKQLAKEEWDKQRTHYEQALQNAQPFLKAQEDNIADLNSRLTAANRILSTPVQPEEGNLDHTITEFKQTVEQGTTLDLPRSFYQDYIQTYYKAEGELRKNREIGQEVGYYKSDYDYDENSFQYHYLGTNQMPDYFRSLVGGSKPTNSFDDIRFLNFKGGVSPYPSGMLFGVYYTLEKEFKRVDSTITDPEDNLVLKGEQDLVKKEDWEKAQKIAPQFKTAYEKYFEKATDYFFNENERDKLVDFLKKKVDYYLLSNEIAYYQWEFEQGDQKGQQSWIDKKIEAQNKYKQMEKDNPRLELNFPKEKEAFFRQWVKENIINLEKKNKIAVENLTQEFDSAIKSSQQQIDDKKAELDGLKQAAEHAKSVFENINPTAEDLAQAEKYNDITQQLHSKERELTNSQRKLEEMVQNFHYHDFNDLGENNYAIGSRAVATGKNNIAFGTEAIASGENAISIGQGNIVSGHNSVAIGTDNTVSGNNTFVLGSNINTTAHNSVILGANSEANEDNVVSVGAFGRERKIVNVANGKISSSSTDAMNGSQLYALKHNIAKYLGAGAAVSADGTTISAPNYNINHALTGQSYTYQNVGSALKALNQNNQYLSQLIADNYQELTQKINNLRKDSYANAAASHAAATLPQAFIPGKNFMAVSSATFRGETGYAIGFSRISQSNRFIIKGHTAGDSRGNFAIGVGTGFHW
ncbi:trimeric autotransporter adhesin [Nicoletella semolina]|uniref:Trimeric autotransporter adhesin n=1 Tax=Nicoletella semolina TaxID=271160 RepID=A0A4R2NB00_9PAST|nr:YadA-like family protein [Nicoletella semolina]MDH2924063.1 hypothetical protein [Nicoletella semolina]TCP18198.1 trimeric autotransporter adhesin [Nicoletella semolina]